MSVYQPKQYLPNQPMKAYLKVMKFSLGLAGPQSADELPRHGPDDGQTALHGQEMADADRG